MATKVRLHWFWRGSIAVLVGLGLHAIWWTAVLHGDRPRVVAYVSMLFSTLLEPHPAHVTALALVDFAFTFLQMVLVVVTYALLTRWFGRTSGDAELICRRCNHILRGLSEPRCPECGETI